MVNIGLEGMMILGTLGAGYFGYHYGSGPASWGRCCFGAVGGVLHALATVIFGVDHIVSGVAINIIAAGSAHSWPRRCSRTCRGWPDPVTVARPATLDDGPGCLRPGARRRGQELVPRLRPGRR